nr:hypothetical protein [uncultured Blautia sp.]
MLTSNQKNKNLLEEFRSQKNRNTLEEYLKKQAWKEDLDGETRIYLVKDSVGRIVLFFSIKCGLLFRKNQYDKLEEYERTYDKNCYGLIQEISKLPENHEAVWQEFSDVYV